MGEQFRSHKNTHIAYIVGVEVEHIAKLCNNNSVCALGERACVLVRPPLNCLLAKFVQRIGAHKHFNSHTHCAHEWKDLLCTLRAWMKRRLGHSARINANSSCKWFLVQECFRVLRFSITSCYAWRRGAARSSHALETGEAWARCRELRCKTGRATAFWEEQTGAPSVASVVVAPHAFILICC